MISREYGKARAEELERKSRGIGVRLERVGWGSYRGEGEKGRDGCGVVARGGKWGVGVVE